MNTADLVIIADACGTGASMRDALEGGPHGGGVEGAMRYFGDGYDAACIVVAPVAVAINRMLPGFRDWLETTRYGDDRYMMVACMEIGNYLAQYRRPTDARMRPDWIPPPRHL
jgi:hypothetical protein